TIPDEAIPEFCGDFLPGLAEVFPVVDRAGRLELPEREAMEFELEIRRYAGPDAADGPDLVVQWNRIEVLRMSDGTGSESRTPLTAAAMGEAGPALADPDVLELASRVEETDWGWVLCAGPGRVTGHDAAVLLADGVDVLEALDRLRGSVWGPVALERFGELGAVLEEVLATPAVRAGSDLGSGVIRIGLGQAGVFADLAELADDLAPPTGRARALLGLASDTPDPVAGPAA